LVVRSSTVSLMGGAPHASRPSAIRVTSSGPGRERARSGSRRSHSRGERRAALVARASAAESSKADQVTLGGAIVNGVSMDKTRTVNGSDAQPRNRP
jgi:hypothetical protein